MRPSNTLCLIIILACSQSVRCLKFFGEPLMLLVSFDGFRWDYLKRFELPNFNYLKRHGSHAEHIKNSFSTVTFPNHWTIVTGMYEESHGIIQNEMLDRKLKKEFSHLSNESQTYEWYGQNKLTEPIWITNQKAGGSRKSAAEWVGGGINFEDQSPIYIPFNKSKPYNKLIDEFISMYANKTEPINFGAMYFDEPDHTGHLHGPYSKEMEEKLYSLDKTLGYLIERLQNYDLFDRLNLIITSDHGMEEITEKTAIFLDSYIDTELFDAYGSRACYSLFIKNETDTEYVYKTLKTVENMEIYKKDEIPDHLHYKNNVRIGDLVIITKLGYGVYINNQQVNWTINRGDHGYNNNNSAMHPIFIAHGPDFKQNYTIKPFNNVDIYPLMCFLLGVEPGLGHNGTLSNVLDMIIYDSNQRKFTILFIVVAISLPIFFLVAAGNLCYVRCKRVIHDEIINENEYQEISENDESVDVVVDTSNLKG